MTLTQKISVQKTLVQMPMDQMTYVKMPFDQMTLDQMISSLNVRLHRRFGLAISRSDVILK